MNIFKCGETDTLFYYTYDKLLISLILKTVT